MRMNGEKMKINFIVPSLGISGGIDVVYKYVNLLSERGHDVCVYKELKATNMHRYRFEIKNDIHQIYCTAKTILQKNKWKHENDKYVLEISNDSIRDADVIIATAWPTAYKVAELSNNKGKKYYFIQDYEIWDNPEWVKNSYKLPLEKVVISSWINSCLKKELNIGPFPIVYNGLDIKIYHHINVCKEEGKINFLMLNHKLEKKGVNNGIKVFEEIKKRYRNCKLCMFGMCDSDNLPNYVEYYQNPTKQKLVELYSESDIFIFPSLEEGWGLTPLEAMACGCIVVGTNVGFVPDLGLHRVNMMISEPGDIEGMINNVEELIENQELFKKIHGEMGKIIHKLDWNASVVTLENILKVGLEFVK